MRDAGGATGPPPPPAELDGRTGDDIDGRPEGDRWSTWDGADELADLWAQLGDALRGLARQGLTHGDLSAFKVLVDDGRLVLIDLPQVVDVVGNPFGPAYPGRDVDRVTEWSGARGLPGRRGAREALFADLLAELGIARPGTSHR